MQNQKVIEETAKQSIRQMQETQLSALESQKKQMVEFAQSVKEEVEDVTSNHGSKFLRNLAITLILATIAGGITSWCVGKYFPAFIQINKAGDIKVQHSAVKIWEADNPKISDSNQKTKIDTVLIVKNFFYHFCLKLAIYIVFIKRTFIFKYSVNNMQQLTHSSNYYHHFGFSCAA